jgi:hypothetical protein
MRKPLSALLLAGMIGWSMPVLADQVTITGDDTIEKILIGQKGKKVTLRLVAGEDLTGTVKDVTRQVVLIGELAGKEYYDAVVATERIVVVIVRAK